MRTRRNLVRSFFRIQMLPQQSYILAVTTLVRGTQQYQRTPSTVAGEKVTVAHWSESWQVTKQYPIRAACRWVVFFLDGTMRNEINKSMNLEKPSAWRKLVWINPWKSFLLRFRSDHQAPVDRHSSCRANLSQFLRVISDQWPTFTWTCLLPLLFCFQRVFSMSLASGSRWEQVGSEDTGKGA